MHGSQSIDYSQIRKHIYKLYTEVIAKKISVREALVNFPKDCDDKTVIASWHALCHLEADEDIRKKDIEYAKEQDDYIKFIAETLKEGNELPSNIIEDYIPYHSQALTPSTNTIKGLIHNFKKFLNC